jgi:DnaK suppressor protein
MAKSQGENQQSKLLRYEKHLRLRQRELERELASTVEQARTSNSNDTQDVADQAVAGYQKELLLSQGSAKNAELRLVEQALNRLSEGTFGECVRCSQTIGAKRIEAVPWTPYCIDCQEEIEKGTFEPTAFVA